MVRKKRPHSKKRRAAILAAQKIADKPLQDFELLVEPQDEVSANRKLGTGDPRIYTKRRKAVEALMSYGNTNADIAAAMEASFGLQYVQTQRLIKATERKWRDSELLSTDRRKQMARSRILSDKQRAARDGAHGAVMAAEGLLMKLDGTEAPKQVEIKVDIGERTMNALARAFESLSPERMQALARAGQARATLLQTQPALILEAAAE